MSVADKLGLGPQRVAERNDDGSWTVTVTPPAFMGLRSASLTLTTDQYARYLSWVHSSMLIQQALPELTPPEREILMTGIGPEDFKEMGASTDD